jgi:hypothetical protein
MESSPTYRSGGWLHVAAFPDGSSFLIAHVGETDCLDCVLHDLPRDRSGTRLPPGRQACWPPVIVAALLLDVVFLAAALGPAAKWVIPTLVVSRRDAKT